MQYNYQGKNIYQGQDKEVFDKLDSNEEYTYIYIYIYIYIYKRSNEKGS